MIHLCFVHHKLSLFCGVIRVQSKDCTVLLHYVVNVLSCFKYIYVLGIVCLYGQDSKTGNVYGCRRGNDMRKQESNLGRYEAYCPHGYSAQAG